MISKETRTIEVIRRSPIDRASALLTIVSDQEVANEITDAVMSHDELRYPGPLECFPWPATGQGEDLTGKVFGRLTVIGYRPLKAHRPEEHESRSKPPKRQALWVCRCTCGWYVRRTTRFLRRPDDLLQGPKMCNTCDFEWAKMNGLKPSKIECEQILNEKRSSRAMDTLSGQ